MESITFAGLEVLLLLLPGFVTSQIISALIVRPPRTELDKVIEALFYSFVIYSLCLVIPGASPFAIQRSAVGGPQLVANVSGVRDFVLWAFGFSVAFGLFMSYANTNDLFTRVLRWVGFTTRSSRWSTWADVFHDRSGFVIVEFADGRRVRGWPRCVADVPEADQGIMFLEQASWLLDDGTAIDISGPGILITKNLPIESVSFVDVES